MNKIKLSKSAFMKGTQCTKSIWLTKYMQELIVPKTFEEQVLLNKGIEVGILARDLYAGGLDVSQGGTVRVYDLIEATKAALQTDQHILYEPAFTTPDLSLRFQADIFVVSEKNTKLIEVKSSTSIKTPEHILDIGFQWHVLKESGYNKPVECYIAYLNKEYVRQGPLELEKLFIIENVTAKAKQVQVLIKRYLEQFDSVLSKKQCPQISIGEHCFKPYTCEFISRCWGDAKVPDYSVFNIGRIRKSFATKLYNEGIKEPSQIPRDEKLTEQQWLEIDTTFQGKPRINYNQIKSFLDSLSLDESIFYMDFESFMPAIPIYNNSRPYQQLCFQYCVLHKEKNSNELIRKEFIAEHKADPRREFIENLLEDTKGAGNIVVYNASFETSRLRELALLFPEYTEEIEERIERVKDLMLPFKDKHYYHPSFKGSYSIKVVLPALVPELSYSELEINNGAIAMNRYENFHKLPIAEQIQTKRALLEYCHLDVLGMVKIIEALQNIVTNK